MKTKLIKKELAEIKNLIEYAESWTKDLPVIREIVKFPNDNGSRGKCSSCASNCCFLSAPIHVSGHCKGPEYEKVKKFYEHTKNLKNNMENMYDVDWFNDETILIGNRNWYRVFRVPGEDKFTVSFACPNLNYDEKCGIYLDRFDFCKRYDGRSSLKSNEGKTYCNYELVFESKPK